MIRPASSLALLLVVAACSTPEFRSDALGRPLADAGCWIRFYERPSFGEPMRQVQGPALIESITGTIARVPDMEDAGAQPLFPEARSLAVGPTAVVIGYSDKMLRGEATVLAGGAQVRDAASVGYPDRFASLKLECLP